MPNRLQAGQYLLAGLLTTEVFYMRVRKSILFLTLIGLIFLSASAFALQSGDFTYTVSDGTVTITKYTGGAGVVVIPATIDGMPVVGIGDGAFEECISLTSVTIGNSVRSIGNGAFAYCSGLISMTIPNSITSIGRQAFGGCSSLTSVTIPDSVTSIGDYAFTLCSSLTSIVVDASNTFYSSQDGVLYDKAKTVLMQYPCGTSGGFTIPNSVTSIGGRAFAYCSGLSSVTIPNSITSIGWGVFAGCSSLTSMIIPNSVTSIGEAAFAECSSLTIVTIPNSITSIGRQAFGGCSSLTSVTIPNSVTSIGSQAFDGCSSLTIAYFLGNAPSIGPDVFQGCSSNFTICYTARSTGFANPWCPTYDQCYPAAVCSPKPSLCAAEAIYGENSEETELLIEYRDNVLSKTPDGQELIKMYYKFSPTVTKLLENRPLLKSRAKAFIDSMLPAIREKVEEIQKEQ
jgi:hypothetical protein